MIEFEVDDPEGSSGRADGRVAFDSDRVAKASSAAQAAQHSPG